MRTALDLGVTLIDSAPAKELVKDGDRITGAVMTINGQDVTISAQKAVVLATGGFPHDKARQAEQFDHTPSGEGHHSAAPKTNTGDGMRMAESAGAALDFTLSQPGAWAPVSRVPDGKGGYINFPHLIERAKPGVMAVDASGKRFVNEADSYHDFMKALLDRHPKGETPHCWLIADHRTQRRWGLGWSRPFPFPVSKYVKNGYLKRGRTLAELARACDLPQDAFTKTIARFNDHARKGVDPDFQRGASRYNRVQGDMTHQPNPSLGPVEKGPFYAVKIVPGSLGTFAGLKTTALGQVLSTDGIPIKGLFSVGNDMASVMGGNYPSGGITLGPGMTFGYVIGRTLAGQPVTAAPSSSSSTTSEDQ